MKHRTMAACVAGVGMVCGVLAGAAAAGQPGGAPEKKDEKKDAKPAAVVGTGVAVVEIFTSEGCDSCPPADDLAAKMAREAKEQGKNVFVLAMHVDYWDYLGWKDPFARHEFTTRQKAYAAAFGKSGGNAGVFTPEMVVNGETGFNGADEKTASAAIDKGLGGGARFKIVASVDPRRPGEPVHVHAKLNGDSRWIKIGVAVVENGLSVEVKAGENKGKTLKHDRVVRALGQTTAKEGEADVDLKLPEGVQEANCRVVVFGQDEKSMSVYGAVEIALEPAKVDAPAK